VRNQPGPRERLLDAAQRLTYQQGVNVGVDALLSEANVARRSLYEHFGGKDGLIAEVLRRASAEDLDLYRAAITAAGDDSRQRLLAVFDMLDQVVGAPDSAAAATWAPTSPSPTRPIRRTLSPGSTGTLVTDQLMLLIEGTLATGAARSDGRPARDARALAQRVLG
jgi:AcrR family transcriptional regulator